MAVSQLPTTAGHWPPQQFSKAFDQYQEDDAWYTSNVDALEWIYAINRIQTVTSMWGTPRRRFWGTPNPGTVNQRPIKIHVPIATDLARMSSSLLFSELPAVQFGDMDHDDDDKGLTRQSAKKISDRVAELCDDKVHAALLTAGEYTAALGGSFLKVMWDLEVVPDKPFLMAVSADSAVPTFRWGRLQSVIFWSDLQGPKQSYRLLEEHTPGRIEWALYEAPSSDGIGMRVPLTDCPAAAHLVDVVDADSGIDTGSTLLTAVYLPNGAPNGAWRKYGDISALSRSDYAGVVDLMDALDECYTSWMRDIRLGKARIMVPEGLIQQSAPGQGGVFNADQEIFTEFGSQVGSLNPSAKHGSVESFIELYQPNIRFKEHLSTALNLVTMIYSQAGYSPQTFGIDSGNDGETATATEVNSREKRTDMTRSGKVLYARPELQHLFAALMDVDQFVFNGPGRGDAMPDIEFADAAGQNPKVLADVLSALNTAEAASIETRVRMLHDDWDQDQIDAEVAQIREDYSMLPDPRPEMLWAAQAATGSATGGVDANSYGDKGVNVPAVTKAPDQGAKDKLTPGPTPPSGA